MGAPCQRRDVSDPGSHDQGIDRIPGVMCRDSGKVQQRDEPMERNLNIDQTV